INGKQTAAQQSGAADGPQSVCAPQEFVQWLPLTFVVGPHWEFRMTVDNEFIPTIYQGWRDYQKALTRAIAPRNAEQLSLRVSSNLRSVREIAAHVIGARARWFSLQFGEGGDAFKAFGSWDRPEAKVWSADEIVKGLEATWFGMQEAITRWTPEDWEQTWP